MQMENQVLQVNIDDIIPNRFQPRVAFDEKGIEELASSIKEHGIIQPLVLRKLGDKYEIIAGERRYKASTLAGLTTVPAVISNIDDNKSAEIALVENIQRRDLTPIEEARSYKNLLDKGYLTQDELAKKMGLSQSTIANKLRLLNLADEVQQALLENKISERHARALLVLNDKAEQVKWLNKIINERMTVRQVDQELKKLTNNEETITDVPLVNLNPDLESIQNNAQDLNAKKTFSVESMMIPEESMVEYDQNDTSSTAQPIPENPFAQFASPDIAAPSGVPENNTQTNKFFNPLESEPAEMSFANAFSDNAAFNMDTNNNDSDEIEIFDMPTTPSTPKDLFEEPQVEEPKIMNSASVELNPNNKFFQPEVDTKNPFNPITPEKEEVINPMNFVDTLQENEPQTIETKNENKLNDSINQIRTLVSTLQLNGVNVKLDEADLENSYQLNIIIEKNN